jgi:hypothetical protein
MLFNYLNLIDISNVWNHIIDILNVHLIFMWNLDSRYILYHIFYSTLLYLNYINGYNHANISHQHILFLFINPLIFTLE